MKTRNHYVTKCYLKMWENSDRNIQVYKKIVSNENEALWRKKKLSQIGYLNDFYIVYDGQSKDNSEQYSDNFEEIFNKTFENRLGRILKKLMKVEILRIRTGLLSSSLSLSNAIKHLMDT